MKTSLDTLKSGGLKKFDRNTASSEMILFILLAVAVIITSRHAILSRPHSEQQLGKEVIWASFNQAGHVLQSRRLTPEISSSSVTSAFASESQSLERVTWAQIYEKYPSLERIHLKNAIRSIERRARVFSMYLKLDDMASSAYRNAAIDAYIELRSRSSVSGKPREGADHDEDYTKIIEKRNGKIMNALGSDKYGELLHLQSILEPASNFANDFNIVLFESGLPILTNESATDVFRILNERKQHPAVSNVRQAAPKLKEFSERLSHCLSAQQIQVLNVYLRN